ncbi:hypothetical protein [Desulfobacula toluolica]|uniref:Conserved uncharacterized protein n=1 Tax=Desulfobacula toluolica (strain DSM 7467 / Tol2) TaxID=651182 RepID=K0NHD8_DESTT|nr:hypothetical protein [Desulfobacula toluolica]CCK80696.1 conserved uncharacterized protein [Desulfobacula toluolica Tol2]
MSTKINTWNTRTNTGTICTALFIFLALSLSAMMVTGCQTADPKPVTSHSCILPKTNNLEQAIAMTKIDLGFENCTYKFENYFENLLTIGAGDPDISNKEKFSDFLMWCNNEGLLTKIQAKKYYNQYFNTLFAALPADYNVCSICPDKESLIQDMEKELSMKEKGLLKVAGDKDTYYKAHEQFETMVFLLDSTCKACDPEGM